MTRDNERSRSLSCEGNGQGTGAQTTQDKKLLDRAWDRLLDAGIQAPAARRYVGWMRDFILFHQKRHPRDMGMSEIQQYLQQSRFHDAGGTEQRAEAERALKFLYESVLERVWPRENRPAENENAPSGTNKAVYLNGQRPGVKLMDRVREALRVGQYALETEKAYVDWARKFIRYHKMKHPNEMGALEVEQFLTYLAVKRQLSAKSQKQALCALVFLYQTVLGRELGWQYLFASPRLSVDPREPQAGKRRHHIHVDSLEKAIKAAVRASGLTKRITAHTLRHSFATHLLETGHNIKKVQDLLGHRDIRTTMIYLHVMESGTTDVRSPLDALGL